jgi:hypothetical protein
MFLFLGMKRRNNNGIPHCRSAISSGVTNFLGTAGFFGNTWWLDSVEWFLGRFCKGYNNFNNV